MTHLTTEQIFDLLNEKPTGEKKKSAFEHLDQCTLCQEEFRSLQLLEKDLKEMKTPEVSSGFALKVVAKMREREIMSTFALPSFRIFRWSFAVSMLTAAGIVTTNLTNSFVTLPHWNFPAQGYFFISAICLTAIYGVDKILSRFQKKV